MSNRQNLSKRQLIRQQREKKQRQQRLLTIGLISLGVIVVAAVIVAPTIYRALTPVGDIVEVPPQDRPQADGRTLGDPNAPVTVEVFEDFQCPACKTYTEEVEHQLVENEVAGGQVHYIFRHYPFLDDRAPANESDQAANASMCAAEQGRFWDYHDMLFANWSGENLGSFADRRLVAFAEALGLDMDQFNSCFQENRYEDEINADFARGLEIGVTGTPSVFVNGTQIRPGFVPSYQDIQQAVQAELGS